MPLDVSGATLGALIANALNLPPPPTNPTPEQEAQYNASKAANLATWTAVSAQIISYLVANTVVTTTDQVTIPPTGVATIISSPTGGPCTGTAIGTGTGTGTIK